MKRRTFLHLGLLGVGTLAVGGLCKAQPGLESLAEQRKLGAVRLLEHYRRRIREVEPKLHCLIELNARAEQLAVELESKKSLPLAGLPILLKDNLATGDGMANTAGALALKDSRPDFDSAVAAKLRQAGALLVGKANMSEWANFRSDRSSSGWSALGGQCRNPHVLDRSPCGSSSGCAAAVAAGLAAAAIGTETVGSIVCPSGTCGVVGLKPTAGLLSGEGIIPIAHSQDTAGPITRTVADAALILGALTDRTFSLDGKSLRGARLGVARGLSNYDERVTQLFETQLAVLVKLGAELVDPVEMPPWAELRHDLNVVLEYEFKNGLNAYLERLGPTAPVTSLEDVIDFNLQHAEAEMLAHFDQNVLLRAQQRGSLKEPEYLEARTRSWQRVREQGLDPVFEKNRLDAIVAPTNGPAWLIDQITGDHFSGGSALPAAVAGYPHITVPGGLVHGLPIGMSFFSPANSEERLLSLAYAYEQATQHRREPALLNTIAIL